MVEILYFLIDIKFFFEASFQTLVHPPEWHHIMVVLSWPSLESAYDQHPQVLCTVLCVWFLSFCCILFFSSHVLTTLVQYKFWCGILIHAVVLGHSAALWPFERTLGLHAFANDVVEMWAHAAGGARTNRRQICPSGVNGVVCMFNGTCKWRRIHNYNHSRALQAVFPLCSSDFWLAAVSECVALWSVTRMEVVLCCVEGSRRLFWPEWIKSHFTDLLAVLPVIHCWN